MPQKCLLQNLFFSRISSDELDSSLLQELGKQTQFEEGSAQHSKNVENAVLNPFPYIFHARSLKVTLKHTNVLHTNLIHISLLHLPFQVVIYRENNLHVLVLRISTLGNMSASWEWPWQCTDTWTACGVFPVTLHPPYVPRYCIILAKMFGKFGCNSEIVWKFARKTTRSASDFPFTAVPFPSEPAYNNSE